MPLNQPSAEALRDALARYHTAPPADPEQARFLDRVAAHLTALLEREAAQHDAFTATENAALDKLAGGHDAATLQTLCETLAGGIDTAALARHIDTLLPVAEAKLAIDNPRYR